MTIMTCRACEETATTAGYCAECFDIRFGMALEASDGEIARWCGLSRQILTIEKQSDDFGRFTSDQEREMLARGIHLAALIDKFFVPPVTFEKGKTA